MKNQFITSVHLHETEYIKKYTEYGELIEIVYKK